MYKRHRGIKSDHFTDELMQELGPVVAYVYIGIWTICDDNGITLNKPNEIANHIRTARKQDVLRALRILISRGRLQVSSCAAYLRVVNWSHQHIDRYHAGFLKDQSIQFVDAQRSGTLVTMFPKKPAEKEKEKENRKGKRKIEKENELKTGDNFRERKQPQLDISTVWQSYSTAYLEKYGTEPVRNAKVNSQLLNFVKRVGLEEASHIIKFYFTHTNPFYSRGGHSVGTLLFDAEKLRTEWKTGNIISIAKDPIQQKEDAMIAQLQRLTKMPL